tara:strand:+ start:113 stop:385 length:273 start_codon:yes stop_codon:yes gene_type:complete
MRDGPYLVFSDINTVACVPDDKANLDIGLIRDDDSIPKIDVKHEFKLNRYMASVRDEVDIKDKTPAEVEKLLADRGFTKDPKKSETLKKL